jgi:hypothetical protein
MAGNAAVSAHIIASTRGPTQRFAQRSGADSAAALSASSYVSELSDPESQRLPSVKREVMAAPTRMWLQRDSKGLIEKAEADIKRAKLEAQYQAAILTKDWSQAARLLKDLPQDDILAHVRALPATDRGDLLDALLEAARKDSHWYEAAVYLNDFNDVDIMERIQGPPEGHPKGLTSGEREDMAKAIWDHWAFRVRVSLLDRLVYENREAKRWDKVVQYLSPFNKDDLLRRVSLSQEDREELKKQLEKTPVKNVRDAIAKVEAENPHTKKKEEAESMDFARKRVHSHVWPRDCFITYVGTGKGWAPISGTGCAHWVAHQLGAPKGKPHVCQNDYKFRVKDVLDSFTWVGKGLSFAKVGHVWSKPDKSHIGIVCKVTRNADNKVVSVDVENDSIASGGVVTQTKFEGLFYKQR